MNPISIAPYIFSKLGNSSSLLPMAVKDAAHTAGMTTAAYVTGKEVEGKDRFIDEFGTQVIWIGGIPFYKKIIDLTTYKLAKYNPKIDVRLLEDKKILQKAIEHAPTEEIKESLSKIAKSTANAKVFKNLALAKFITATALTLTSYFGLTHFRHKHTEQNIIKKIQKEENQKRANQEFIKKQLNKDTFNTNQKDNKNPSFGSSFVGTLQGFMLDPVKNMMIVDGGITGERFAESRNWQDLFGYVIKEGSFWAFMYFAGEKIQKHFEKTAENTHKKSIDLDIRVLQDKELKKALESGNISNNIDKIKNLKKEELYDFLCTNEDNLVVKMAKKADIIKIHKETGKVDTQHFIDLEKVKGVGEKIEKLFNQYNNSGEKLEEFLQKTIKLKRGSIIKNIGVCISVLGVIVPGMMLAARYMHKDNKEFQTEKEIKEKLQNQAV